MRWVPFFTLLLCGCHSIASYDAVLPVDASIDLALDAVASMDLTQDLTQDTAHVPMGCTVEPVASDAIVVQHFEEIIVDVGTAQLEMPAEPGDAMKLVGSGATLVEGPGSCGRALHLDGASSSYGLLEEDLRLEQGEISVWVRFERDGVLEGVFSRDRVQFSEPGHLTLMRTPSGRVMFRLQGNTLEEADQLCSLDVVPVGVWHHIRISFGGGKTSLSINGDERLYIGPLEVTNPEPWTCTEPGNVPHGIEGNSFPLVVGTTLMNWSGELPLASSYYLQGAIDELVINGRLGLP
ncbi:MAG: LamG domain-containing protein [Deltaproteobacteria bacterium]|nr:LamG domain-containing protein [Deltaproteobacteria bacterium]